MPVIKAHSNKCHCLQGGPDVEMEDAVGSSLRLKRPGEESSTARMPANSLTDRQQPYSKCVLTNKNPKIYTCLSDPASLADSETV